MHLQFVDLFSIKSCFTYHINQLNVGRLCLSLYKYIDNSCFCFINGSKLTFKEAVLKFCVLFSFLEMVRKKLYSLLQNNRRLRIP